MRISRSQLFWIMCLFQPYYIMGYAIQKTHQDAWVVMVIGTCMALMMTWFLYKLTRIFSNRTIIGFTETVFGKWLAMAIGAPYVLAWISSATAMMRDSIDYVNLVLLPHTPTFVVFIALAIACVYLIQKGGITGIGRYAEVVGPLMVLVSYVPLAMTPVDMDWRWLQPVFVTTDIRNMVKTSYIVASQMAEPAIVMLMLLRFVSHSDRALPMVLWSVTVQSIYMTLGTAAAILLFGPQLGGLMTFPPLAFIKSISLLDFIQNIDVFAALIWLPHYIVLIAVCVFVSAYAIRQLVHTRRISPFTLGITILMTGVAIFSVPVTLVNQQYRMFWSAWVFPTLGLLIPIVLWVRYKMFTENVRR